MKRITLQTFIAALLAIILIIIAFLVDFLTPLKITSEIISGIITAIIVFLSSYFIRNLSSAPRPLTLAIIGPPAVGKTVYLTVLFDIIQTAEFHNIRFTPYGEETFEQVHSDLNILSSGQWLKPTKPGSVFYYRATTSIGGSIFPKRLKIEIADYAGEHIDEFNPSSELWLHKTSFFRYIVDNEGLFLALDLEFLLTAPKADIEVVQNAYVSAFQILLERKGIFENKKFNPPVAILFLKSDILESYNKGKILLNENLENKTETELYLQKNKVFHKKHDVTSFFDRTVLENKLDVDKDLENEILRKIPRLIRICQKRCRRFNMFFVSATGGGDKNTPPDVLQPINVTHPLLWIIKNLEK